jgi:predicted AAA+ superfamily ATPase
MAYQRRVIDDQLDALLPIMPAILLDGPKGVGKTETALQRATTTFRLDDPTRLQIVRASPELALQQPSPVLFDEWQRMPAIWDAVKRAVDSETGPEGPFLLTGSAYVPGVTTHSGAGRIHDLRMRPMTLPERGVTTPTVSVRSLLAGGCDIPLTNATFDLQDYVEEIMASGFPGIRRL